MYKQVRSRLSDYTARRLQAWHQQRTRAGVWPAVDATTWARTPLGVRKWLRRRVLRPLEGVAKCGASESKYLSQVLSDNMSGWALSASTLAFLARHLETHQPHCILEFGSGASTKLFALYAREMKQLGKHVTFVSLEHDQDWLNQSISELKESGLNEFVHLFHSDLVSQPLNGREIVSYKLPQECEMILRSAGGVDLFLIDGPPRRVGRSGCLPVAAAYLAENATIILDDAFRPEELNAMKNWFASFDGKLSRPSLLLLDSHGTGLMKWHCQEVSA